jgi:hypothetical protein
MLKFYLDLKMVVTERPGQTSTVKVGNLAHNFGIPKEKVRAKKNEPLGEVRKGSKE